jgi:hypothetical protein
MGRAQYRNAINQGEAQQFARPVPQETAIFRALHQKPQDTAYWGILADHHEDQGRPLFADLLRRLGESVMTRYAPSGYKLPGKHIYRSYTEGSLWKQLVGYNNTRPHFAVGYSPRDVSPVFGIIGTTPVEAHLRSITDDPEVHRRGPTSDDPLIPYGDLRVTTSHGRTVGRAQLPIDQFEGIVHEGKGYSKASHVRSNAMWEHLKDSIVRRKASLTGSLLPREY